MLIRFYCALAMLVVLLLLLLPLHFPLKLIAMALVGGAFYRIVINIVMLKKIERLRYADGGWEFDIAGTRYRDLRLYHFRLLPWLAILQLSGASPSISQSQPWAFITPCSRYLPLLPDSTDVDSFRRLRVLLRIK